MTPNMEIEQFKIMPGSTVGVSKHRTVLSLFEKTKQIYDGTARKMQPSQNSINMMVQFPNDHISLDSITDEAEQSHNISLEEEDIILKTQKEKPVV